MTTNTPGDTKRVPVYLIGGAAGAGKTTLAANLARELGMSWLQADSTWLAMKSITTMESNPELRFFPELEDSAIAFDEFDRQFQVACVAVCRALETVIDHEIEGRPAGFVIEGTWIPPGWMASLRERSTAADIRALLLHEDDAGVMLASLVARSRLVEVTSQQRHFAEWSWRIGRRLADDARSAGIPVVESRPRSTLMERAMAAFATGANL